MIQNTVQRLLPLISIENLYVGTHQEQALETLRQLDSFAFSPNHLLAEPCSKNTALAIGLMAKIVEEKDSDAIMAIFPADHVISNTKKFSQILKKAEVLAQKGFLVTLGIPPTRPETGFGYLKQGMELEGSEDTYLVDRFEEKPDLSKAKKYLEQGTFFWNCGIFVWKASTILGGPTLALALLFLGIKINRRAQLQSRIPTWMLCTVTIGFAVTLALAFKTYGKLFGE